MLPFKLVYHDRYDLKLGAHVFPSQKYRLVHDKLIADQIASGDDFLEPQPATDADVLRVHTQDYVYKLKNGSLTHAEILRMENPILERTGGRVLACRRRLNPGGTASAGRWMVGEHRRRLPSRLCRSWRRFLPDPRCSGCDSPLAVRPRDRNSDGCGYGCSSGQWHGIDFRRRRRCVYALDSPGKQLPVSEATFDRRY